MRAWLLHAFFLTIFSLLLFCGSETTVRAQSHYYDLWYFGDSLGLDFRTGLPTYIKGSLSTSEGSASICDPVTGNLLFYTDGITIWNRDHIVMRNGQGLLGHSSTQSALIVPDPGNSHLFYVFTSDALLSQDTGINYSIVDMREENGRGAVVAKNVHLLRPAVEKLTAVRHCNGRDFWVIAHEARSPRFFAWKVTPEGISPNPVISSAGTPQTSIGYLKASPNGRYLFSIDQGGDKGDLLPFDPLSGAVGPAIITLVSHYGASFSPDNQFLYVTEEGQFSRLVQYRISSINPSVIAASKSVVDSSSSSIYRALQLGPDGKIYILRGGISVIEYPNVAGPACSVVPLPAFGTVWYGLPNCIDGFIGKNSSSLTVNPDTAICYGGGVFLQASGAAGYRWEPSDGLDCDTCAAPFASPLTTTTYQVTGFKTNGCAEVRSVTVTVRKSPNVVTGNDTMVCTGATAQLHADGGIAYRWEPAEGLTCSDCPSPVALPSATTTYYVTVTGENGCTARDSMTVYIDSAVAAVTASVSDICRGEAVPLHATGSGRFQWEPSEGLSCADCSDPIASPERTITYTVRLVSGGGCLSTDSVTVTVHESPVVDAGPDTVICAREGLQLHADAGGEPVEFLWEPNGEMSCLDCADPVVHPRIPTTYVVLVKNKWGCVARDSVTVGLRSGGTLRLTSDTGICAGNSVRLTAAGAERYWWTPVQGLSCTDCPDPIAHPDRTTTYYVVGTNALGECGAVDSVQVVVYDIPVTEGGGEVIVCGGGKSVQLRADGAVAYRWDPSPDLSCLDCPDPMAVPTGTTTYYVTGIGPGGCESRDSVQVIVRSGIELSAGEDQTICAGGSVRLGVDDGVRWQWSPAEGLSCTDCPDPEASPVTTTTYRVQAWNGEGCEGKDEVTVVVRQESATIPLRIGRAYRGSTGRQLIIPVETIGPVVNTDLTELKFTLEYDPRVMVVDAGTIERLLSGTLLDGWQVYTRQSNPGRLEALLTSPSGRTLSGKGELLRFESRMYLAGVYGTELSFSVIAPQGCYLFSTEPGYAELDSICGLSLRLIEVGAEKYSPPVTYPNPTAERLYIEFGLGLSGETRLEVFDGLGKRAALLADTFLNPGRYVVEWDVRQFAPGLYWYRLTSGDWSRTGQLRIAE